MILQPDGKILIGGFVQITYRTTNFAVGRYNSDGTVAAEYRQRFGEP